MSFFMGGVLREPSLNRGGSLSQSNLKSTRYKYLFLLTVVAVHAIVKLSWRWEIAKIWGGGGGFLIWIFEEVGFKR